MMRALGRREDRIVNLCAGLLLSGPAALALAGCGADGGGESGAMPPLTWQPPHFCATIGAMS